MFRVYTLFSLPFERVYSFATWAANEFHSNTLTTFGFFFFLLRFVAVVPLMIRTIFIIFFAQKMNKRKSLFGFCYMLKLQEEEEEEKDDGNKIQAKKENTAVFLRNKTITSKMDTKKPH